jgi:uroporphyrin-III C-methyltransferase
MTDKKNNLDTDKTNAVSHQDDADTPSVAASTSKETRSTPDPTPTPTPAEAPMSTSASTNTKSSSQSVAKNSAKNSAKKSSSFFAWILWLLLVALFIVGAYMAWQWWQGQNTRLQKIEAQLQEQASWVAQAMTQQSSLVEKQAQQLSQWSARVEKDQQVLQQRIDAHANRLNTLSGGRRDSWVLEEARYLLRLANQRQLTGGGVDGVIGLVKSADALLRELDAPDLFPLRESMNKDILALKMAPVLDREGIYLQLSALQDQIDQLPSAPIASTLTDSTAKQHSSISVENMAEVEGGWQSQWWKSIKGTFGQLDNYIRITHHDDPLQPLLSAHQQEQMVQNLHLIVEQAQVALLREETLIYQQSLAKVVALLNAHYSHYPEKQALVDQILVLQQQTIKSVLPVISSSLIQLNNYIQQQTTSALLAPPTETTSTVEKNTHKKPNAISGKEAAL